jgi:hypothetical protein
VSFLVNLSQKSISSAQCVGSCEKYSRTNRVGITSTKDGPLIVSGATDMENNGQSAFKITIVNNGDGSFNIQSTIVTSNDSPMEVTMSGTSEDGSPTGGFLLNVVPQVLNTPFTPKKSMQEDQSDTDVKLDKNSSGGTATNGVKNANETEFKSTIESDKEKSKIPVRKTP